MPVIIRAVSWKPWLAIAAFVLSSVGVAGTGEALAQRRPIADDTLGDERSVVTPVRNLGGRRGDRISGGARRGANLFHSFREFHIEAGRAVYFANPAGVENILGRVTGGVRSAILGRLGVLGNANLFLINPSGMLFGPNASLDVRGAFVASTADSLTFDNGYSFSASTPNAPPLLTVNVPVGLQYGARPPGEIINRGNLRVDSGQSLLLSGGDITVDAGILWVNYPQGGGVELAAIAGAGTVGLQRNGDLFHLSVPEGMARSDVQLINQAVIDARADDGGSIAIDARNLDILGNSAIRAGIRENRGTVTSQAGDVTLNATGVINIGGSSQVENRLYPNATGNGGNITISASSVALRDGASIGSDTFGRGSAGNVTISVNDALSLTGMNAAGANSSISSVVGERARGNAGNITIEADSVALRDGGSINSSTLGQGDAGAITLRVGEELSLAGEDGNRQASFIQSAIAKDAIGNGGNITITAGSVALRDGASISNSTLGWGNAGTINLTVREGLLLAGANSRGQRSFIENGVREAAVGNGGNSTIRAGSVTLRGGASISSSTYGQGNAGSIDLSVTDALSLIGVNSSRQGSFIESAVRQGAIGNGGNISIEAGSIALSDGGFISNSTSGQGNAGNISIRAGSVALSDGSSFSNSTYKQGDAGNIDLTVRDDLSLAGANSRGQRSFIENAVAEGAVGEGGDITITAGSVTLRDGASISNSTLGRGNAGSIDLSVTDALSLTGVNSSRQGSFIESAVRQGAIGNGGNISITAGSAELRNGASISNGTSGQGNAGNVNLSVADTLSLAEMNAAGANSFISSAVGERARGNAGNITIEAGSVELRDGGSISNSTLGQGDAGAIALSVGEELSLAGADGNRQRSFIESAVAGGAIGNGGNISIRAGSVELRDGSSISNSTSGQGNAGSIALTARERLSLTGVNSDRQGSFIESTVRRRAVGNGGNIRIEAGSVALGNGAFISNSTSGRGNAGNVNLSVADTLSLAGMNAAGANSSISSAVGERARGNAGNITIEAGSVELRDGGSISSSTLGQGNAGAITLRVGEGLSLAEADGKGQRSFIESAVAEGAIGNGGNITIEAGSVALRDGASISNSTFGQGNAGAITLRVGEGLSLAGANSRGYRSFIESAVRQGAVGNGGNITIEAGSVELRNGASISNSTFGQGNAGTIDLWVREDLSLAGTNGRGQRSFIGSAVDGGAIGNGGEITLTADSLDLRDRARLSVTSFGEGQAGSLEVQARNIHLEDAAQISAETRVTGRGGNITLRDVNTLLLRNGSFISTTAGTRQAGGDGGNITLDADFIVALPDENSDIRADAYAGNGGNIAITTEGLFGIEPRTAATEFSDITASSELGVQGAIEINRSDVDPSQGLMELPTDVVDVTNQIAQSCPGYGNVAEELGEFIVTGRGGLPPSPTEVFGGETVLTELVTDDRPSSEPQQRAASSTTNGTAQELISQPVHSPASIVEAQRWQVGPDGKVMLVAQASHANVAQSSSVPCQPQ